MSYSGESQKAGQSRPKYRLELEARASLKGLSPQAAWLQLESLVYQAMEYEYPEAEHLAQQMNWPSDLRGLQECMGVVDPVRTVNEFHYSNPKIDLSQLMRLKPLKALEAVLHMSLDNDRWNSPEGSREYRLA